MKTALALLALAFALTIQSAQAVPKEPEVKEWSIFFYVAGDEEEIEIPSRNTIKSIELIPSLKDNTQVNLIVQHDDVGEDFNYRYEIVHVEGADKKAGIANEHLKEKDIQDFSEAFEPDFKYEEKDSGNPVTLKKFLRWGMKRYPARHYGVVGAGHNWGQQGGFQDFAVVDPKTKKVVTLDKSTIMKNYEVRRVMEELSKELNGGKPFDFYLIDGCVAGQLDSALEYRNVFKYSIFTALETPFNSIAYNQVMDDFVKAVNTAKLPLAARESDNMLEEKLLKKLVKGYVHSHSRVGSLIHTEKQIDTTEMFAIRNYRLNYVGQSLGRLMKVLPKEFREDWLKSSQDDEEGKKAKAKVRGVEMVRDTDSNADLWQLSGAFAQYFAKQHGKMKKPADLEREVMSFEADFPDIVKNLKPDVPNWEAAEVAALALRESLGYHAPDPTTQAIDIAHATAEGAWAHVQVDDVVPSRDWALCYAIKAYAGGNSGKPAILPTFTDKKNKQISIHEVKCDELAEGQKKKFDVPQKPLAHPTAVKKVFSLKTDWPGNVPAYFTEFVDSGKVVRRTVSFWFGRGTAKTLQKRALLWLTSTTEIDLDFVKEEKHAEDYLKTWAKSAPNKALLADHKEIRWANKEEPGYVSVTDPDLLKVKTKAAHAPGLYVAEAHTNASHFKHGLGIFFGYASDFNDANYSQGRRRLEDLENTPFFKTKGPKTMEEYYDELTKLDKWDDFPVVGSAFYRLHRINETGWPDFIFGVGK